MSETLFGDPTGSHFGPEPTPEPREYTSTADLLDHGDELAGKYKTLRHQLDHASDDTERLHAQYGIDRLAAHERDGLHREMMKSRDVFQAVRDEAHADHELARNLLRTVAELHAERTDANGIEVPQRIGVPTSAAYEGWASKRVAQRLEEHAERFPYGQLDAKEQKAADSAALEADLRLHELNADPELKAARFDPSHARYHSLRLEHEQLLALVSQRSTDRWGTAVMPDARDPSAWPESMAGLLPAAREDLWRRITHAGAASTTGRGSGRTYSSRRNFYRGPGSVG